MPCTTLSTQIYLATGAQGEMVVNDSSQSGLTPFLKDVPSERSGLAILAMATQWQSCHGGLSTFNRELCIQLVAAGQRVVCVVPSAQAAEIQAAKEAGVTLVPAKKTPGTDDISSLLRRLELPADFVPDVVIGHGRITGPPAQAQVQDFFGSAFRVHFVHMAPGEIEWFKGKNDAAAQAEAREKLEVKLAEDAGLVVAVGPRLYTEVGNSLAGLASPPQLHRLDPGIDESPSRTPPPGIHCLVLGRAEDWELKGLDIAARAMAQTISSGIDFEYVPELVVRGAPKESDTELRQRLLELIGDADLSIRVREYTADEDTIDQDLRRSSLVLMPSRREGFGLVALEALSAGTPILVSNKSGFGQLLGEHLSKAEIGNFVVQTPDAVDKAADKWADAIKFVLRDRQSAFSRTADLNQKLLSKVSWSSAVTALLDAIKRAQG